MQTVAEFFSRNWGCFVLSLLSLSSSFFLRAVDVCLCPVPPDSLSLTTQPSKIDFDQLTADTEINLTCSAYTSLSVEVGLSGVLPESPLRAMK